MTGGDIPFRDSWSNPTGRFFTDLQLSERCIIACLGCIILQCESINVILAYMVEARSNTTATVGFRLSPFLLTLLSVFSLYQHHFDSKANQIRINLLLCCREYAAISMPFNRDGPMDRIEDTILSCPVKYFEFITLFPWRYPLSFTPSWNPLEKQPTTQYRQGIDFPSERIFTSDGPVACL